MKRKDADLAISLLRFPDSSHMNIHVTQRRGSVSLTLSQPNKMQFLLTSPARLHLSNVKQKPENVLHVTEPSDAMDLSGESISVKEILSKSMNLFFYIHDADICELEELHTASSKENLLESADLIFCNPCCNVRRYRMEKSLSHDVFGPNNMAYFCKRAKWMTMPRNRCHSFRFRFSFPRCSKTEVLDRGQRSCKTRRGRRKQSGVSAAVLNSGHWTLPLVPVGKRLNRLSVVEQYIRFWQKGLSFSEAI